MSQKDVFVTSFSKKDIIDVDDIILQCIIFNAYQRQKDYFNVPPTASNRFDINMFNCVEKWISDNSICSSKKIDIILSKDIPNYFLPLFGKGIERLRSLRHLMYFGRLQAYNISEDMKFWKEHTYEEKIKIIGLFIVINQIFSDANHRTSGYFMKKMDLNLDSNDIENLMKVFERLHRDAICYPYDEQDISEWLSSNQNIFFLLIKK